MSKFITLFAATLLVLAVMSPSPVGAANAPADDAHSAEGKTGDGHENHDTSPPLKPEPDLVIWSLVSFAVFAFLLSKLAWGPLIEGLDGREAGLRQQAAETQHALEKAQSLLAEHEAKVAAAQDEVKEIIAEARRDAERTSQDILAAAQAEAESTRARAVEDVNRAKDVAIAELFDVMSGQVAGATEHVLGRALSDEDQNRLIGDALKQVASA